jgi:hypothetical protein
MNALWDTYLCGTFTGMATELTQYLPSRTKHMNNLCQFSVSDSFPKYSYHGG